MGISWSRKGGPARQVMPVREVAPCVMLDDVLELNERPLLCAVEQPTDAMRSGNPGESRTIFCHDMDGNYKEDRFIHGSDQANVHRLSHHGHIVDAFINYSHHVEATHSPGWTTACQWHGVGFQVFTLFLLPLGELIHVHSAGLHSWLYVLLPRLFIKTGTDLSSSLQMKIQKILSIIRDCFAHGNQFQASVIYITDPTQTPNIKVKITILRYLMYVLQAMDSGDLLVNTPETHSMVAKIFSWIRDQKGPEQKRVGRVAAFHGAVFENTFMSCTYKDTETYPSAGQDIAIVCRTGNAAEEAEEVYLRVVAILPDGGIHVHPRDDQNFHGATIR
ncbi:hypothetical protein HPB50_014222 [Hyalomma asiaticum]|uniref:Uncharacterized protein n=1 Tax=Hyalomma asiaticum TaxID=266040 RepID=A0ACB7THV8_HYAAI|nr:hypothetical protein HPB50_014222 [Hyalomma asiaticum]